MTTTYGVSFGKKHDDNLYRMQMPAISIAYIQWTSKYRQHIDTFLFLSFIHSRMHSTFD